MDLLEPIKIRSASLVAEWDGEVVGFLFGDAAAWEYGIPDTTGTLEVLGVHPRSRKKGVGVVLVDEMIRNFRKIGVSRVYTFVNWRSSDVLGFFNSIGFRLGDMINLELDLEPMGGAQ
jgi:GNAT superfamily N-acetyltransferase